MNTPVKPSFTIYTLHYTDVFYSDEGHNVSWIECSIYGIFKTAFVLLLCCYICHDERC